MKNIIHLIRSVLLFQVLTSFAVSTLAQEVSIPDPGLKAAIREALQKPAGPLTEQDLLNLTELHAESRSISNLHGLEAAHNLTALRLQSNQLANIDLPASLAKLTQLDLRANQLTDLTLPAGLTNLIVLSIEANPFTTLVLSEPLAVTTNLAPAIATLRNQGVSVFTYPLAIRLVASRPTVAADVGAALTGPPGIYAVLSSTNLTAWSELGGVTNHFGSAVFTNANAHLSPQRFFRVRRQDPPTNMVFIPPNTFTMGSPSNDPGRSSNEGPQTTVILTRGFWIGKYEVTQGEYLSLMNTNPSEFPGDLSRPISSVTWLDATNYCAKLTQRELAAGRIPAGSQYRLPTEAEWECAARAGTTTRFSYGDDPDYTSLTNYAWFLDFSSIELTVRPVGQKLPNPWGLHDVHGNVWEWCQDWYGNLPGGVRTDPTGPASNPWGDKVMRGGGFDYPNSSCRSASRLFFPASLFRTDWNLGFRVVLLTGPE